MLNTLSLLGPSRCGKSATIPLITSAKNIELPFNTPDLDWYVDAYNCGDISANALSRLSATYMLCYSWYGHLGRHINLRSTDYYSLQNMMPNINLKNRHDREDKDNEFKAFMKANDSKKIWNVFLWDMPPEIHENMKENFPINTNPIYIYRSPFYLFTSWVSSHRVARSKSLSRMHKYHAAENLQNSELNPLFMETRTDTEFIWKDGKYTYFDFQFDDIALGEEEENALIKLIKQNKEDATYWSNKGMMFPYEYIVTDPYKFIEYLKERFGLEFNQEILEKGIRMMDKRPLEQVIELDIKKAEKSLSILECNDSTKELILVEQENYISGL